MPVKVTLSTTLAGVGFGVFFPMYSPETPPGLAPGHFFGRRRLHQSIDKKPTQVGFFVDWVGSDLGSRSMTQRRLNIGNNVM